MLPQHLRKARVSWSAVANSKWYVLDYRESKPNARWDIYCLRKNEDDECADNTIDGTSYDIKLDQLLEGMSNPKLDHELRVKAYSSSSSYANSDYSSVVRIVDNPIIRADGDNSDAADDAETGNAKIKWARATGAIKYSIRYREVTGDDDASTWRANNFGSTLTAHPQGLTTHTISGLGLDKIYALQMNYELNGQKVFSGRDMFVWPSDGFTDEDERVATYPYFGHWPTKEYRYRICVDTFPDDTYTDKDGNTTTKRLQWVKIIEKAFEQWETATDDLISMTRRDVNATTCSSSSTPPATIYDLVRIYPYKEDSLNINDIYMVDDDLLSNRQTTFTEFIGSGIPGQCVFHATACVISKAYGQSAHAGTRLSNVAGSPNGVDMLFAKSKFATGNVLEIPDSIAFNHCITESNIDLTNKYDAYKTALHEAGHALGSSGFSHLDLVSPIWNLESSKTAIHRRAHPSIPDAVMNYNQRVPEISDEPDCSPHPFDILAIYALYQTVE